MDVRKTIDSIIEISRNNSVSELYLFGSFAKRTYHDNSDIGIVVDDSFIL